MVLRCCYKAINQTPKKEYLTKNAMIVEVFVSMQEFLITNNNVCTVSKTEKAALFHKPNWYSFEMVLAF